MCNVIKEILCDFQKYIMPLLTINFLLSHREYCVVDLLDAYFGVKSHQLMFQRFPFGVYDLHLYYYG